MHTPTNSLHILRDWSGTQESIGIGDSEGGNPRIMLLEA